MKIHDNTKTITPYLNLSSHDIICIGQKNVPNTVKSYINNQAKTNNGEVISLHYSKINI